MSSSSSKRPVFDEKEDGEYQQPRGEPAEVWLHAAQVCTGLGREGGVGQKQLPSRGLERRRWLTEWDP